MQSTRSVQLLHDLWVVLTLGTICGWVALFLALRQILEPLKRIWPQLYRLFQFVALALFGVIMEISCADIAAYFFEPVIVHKANLYIRLSGRAFEALFVTLAFIASMTFRIEKNGG